MPTNSPPNSGPLHFLVTAGPTREKIDDVRDWGNIFTGKTGLDLALAFTSLGSVTLLTSNDAHARDFDGYSGTAGMIGVETFRSHADLHALLQERLTSGDPIHAAAMTAAVADYAPAATYRVVSKKIAGTRETWEVENVSAPKVKSTHDEIAVLGTRTLKLIDQFRTAWNFRGLLIKFKLEVAITDDQLLAVASASRTASDADLMVANTLAMARPADGSGGGGGAAYLIDDQKTERVPRAALAQQIVAWTRTRLTR